MAIITDAQQEEARIQAGLFRREMLRREKARRFYKEYLAYVHRGWKRTRMSEYIADRVQKFVETPTGHAYDILAIMTPPQHGKSLTVTESFVSWYIGKHPEKRCIIAAYNDGFAEKFGRRNQEKIEEFGGALFGVKRGMGTKKWTKEEWELDGAPGAVISRGIMSGITGNPADLLVIDDPIKNREQADSETYRQKLWEAWTEVLKTRLQAGAKVIIIMTPWHEDDLMGRILNKRVYGEENVTVIRLPVEAEENDPLGRKPGDALCPELGKDNEWLTEFKRIQMNDPTNGGARAWSALYMCSPRTEGGNILKREWWRFYDPDDKDERKLGYGSVYLSVDAAFKDGEKNDFVALQVWGKRGIDYFLLHSVNKHLNFQGTIDEIRRLKTAFPTISRILVEDKANGSAIIQVLQREMLGVIGINPYGGKESRVNAVSAAIESGHVFLPKNGLWVEEFIEQCSMFPAGKHDDMVDSMSQCLQYMIYANASGGLSPLGEAETLRLRQSAEADGYMTDNRVYDAIYDGDGAEGDAYGGIYGEGAFW